MRERIKKNQGGCDITIKLSFCQFFIHVTHTMDVEKGMSHIHSHHLDFLSLPQWLPLMETKRLQRVHSATP